MDISNQSLLITGASRGLGRALAQAVAERGARVVMVARQEGPLLEAVESIRAAGGDAHALVADVGDSTAAARIAGAAAAMVGPIDVVVHNASTLGPTPLKPLSETSDDELAEALAVNLVGAFRITRSLIGSMVTRGAGTVVHISSDAAVEAYPSWGAYGVSKAALDHLSRIWATELHGSGVRVLAVDPGEMDTQMHADAMPDADPSTLARPEAVARRIVHLLENERLGANGARVEAARIGEPARAGGAS